MVSDQAETHKFQAEVNQVLHLVIHSLYSHKEVFLRELISNASDALDKLKFRALTDDSLLASEDDGGSGEPRLEIRISADSAAGTLTIDDDGIGMTRDELVQNLGTIAHSGSKALLAQLAAANQAQDSAGKLGLIGQFGVGFYSAFLVADKVEVTTRQAGGTQAWRWTSSGEDSFTVEEATRSTRGTSVTLHLKAGERRFAEDWELKELVRRYSDYVGHPIQLRLHDKGEASTDVVPRWERLNRATALWQRAKADISDAEYTEFYKHLTRNEGEEPLARTHFRVEGTQEFVGLLYIPRDKPFDLQLQHRGLRLFVRRVFVMDHCEELLPEWLRFVRGVVDSDDLPLNVSRETLQDSQVVRSIRRQLQKRVLDLLEELAKDRPADYALFWRNFGPVMKTGLHLAGEHKSRVVDLLRVESTHEDALSSLRDYVGRMKPDQKAIYYAFGDNKDTLAKSPHLEALRGRGYEVLLLTDPIDEFAMESVGTYDDKPIISVTRADLDLPTDAAASGVPVDESALQALLARVRSILQDHVSEVRLSTRLLDSPVCLVVPSGGLSAHMERVLRTHGHDVGKTKKRILELNAKHPLVIRLGALAASDPVSPAVTDGVEVLYGQALITEGTALPDPQGFARRLSALLEKSLG